MDVELRGRKVALNKDDVLGRGGEALIFKDPDNPQTGAIKLYHDPDKFRANKLKDLFRKKFNLPETVIFPQEPIYKPSTGEITGFTMKQLDNRFRKLLMIFKRSFCQTNGITTKMIVEMFSQKLRDLLLIHSQGLVVGDLNENNQMIHEKNFLINWIDTDSWQFGKYPCKVGTQLYLCPELYNVDLSKKPMFEPFHDWWSFTVMLTRALLGGVHPFRSGDHSKWKSVTSRAENGATVFDGDVSYPDIGLPPEVLTDDLINRIIKTLKIEDRTPFPEDELKRYKEILIECKSCGIWYPATRPNCPGCSKKTIIDMQMREKIAGLEAINLLTTEGKILHFQKHGKTLYCVTVEKGMVVLYRKDGNRSFTRMEVVRNKFGMEFSIFNGLLVICEEPASFEPELYIMDVQPGKEAEPVAMTTTRSFAGGQAVYSSTNRFMYRIAERMLLCSERDGNNLLERPVTQVFSGQTWFTAHSDEESDKEFIFGFDRVFNDLKWFFILGDADTKRFVRYEAAVSDTRKSETILEMDIKFSSSQILLIMKTRYRGNDYVRMDTISVKDGSSAGSYIFKQDQVRPDDIFGKAFLSGIVMHPTDKGVVRESLKDGSIAPLNGTEKYIHDEDQLFPLGDGILAVKESDIVLLKPKK